MVRNFLKQIFNIYAFTLFLLLMLLLFPFIVIASFWGKVKGGNVIYSICKLWGNIWCFLVGIHHINIESVPLTGKEHYIFVANHISYMDVPVMMKAMKKHNFRILGKQEMSKIPIFGYIYRKAVVMVDRSSAKDRAESIRILLSVLKKNISVFIFPEGTFNETHHPVKNFYDGAFRVAIETETPIKPVVFLDNYDRLNYKSLLSLTPGKTRAIFLEESSTKGLAHKDIPILKQKIFLQMEKCLIENNASWIQRS